MRTSALATWPVVCAIVELRMFELGARSSRHFRSIRAVRDRTPTADRTIVYGEVFRLRTLSCYAAWPRRVEGASTLVALASRRLPGHPGVTASPRRTIPAPRPRVRGGRAITHDAVDAVERQRQLVVWTVRPP
jgi:hypothetical protein